MPSEDPPKRLRTALEDPTVLRAIGALAVVSFGVVSFLAGRWSVSPPSPPGPDPATVAAAPSSAVATPRPHPASPSPAARTVAHPTPPAAHPRTAPARHAANPDARVAPRGQVKIVEGITVFDSFDALRQHSEPPAWLRLTPKNGDMLLEEAKASFKKLETYTQWPVATDPTHPISLRFTDVCYTRAGALRADVAVSGDAGTAVPHLPQLVQACDLSGHPLALASVRALVAGAPGRAVDRVVLPESGALQVRYTWRFKGDPACLAIAPEGHPTWPVFCVPGSSAVDVGGVPSGG